MTMIRVAPPGAITSEELGMFREMTDRWARLMNRNRLRMAHYEGEVNVKDLGISVPPPMAAKLKRVSMMWSRQAVDRIADCSVIDGISFVDGPPEGFSEMVERNELLDQYDEVLPSQLVHGCSFWTVTAGEDGEPAAGISTHDAEHATAIYDFRRRRVLAGLSIVDVDRHDPMRATAANFFSPDGSIIEMRANSKGQWTSRRFRCGSGRCMMEAMRNSPRKGKPFGQSAITRSILSLEDEANREAVRMVMHSELYTAPTRWVMGAPDDIFENGRWEAYLGSIFALPINDEGDKPSTGSYSVGDFQPHIAYIRQLANQFAAEASIPIHSLLYTEANPASAEAIEASRNDLVEKVARVNRVNARTLRNVGLLALSLMQEVPVAELGDNERSLRVDFANPRRATLGQMADAASKTVADVPEFAGTRHYWKLKGYRDDEVEEIMSDLSRGNALTALATISAAMRDEG